MSEMSTQEMRAAILRGLQDMQERFARDPRPTDGSVRAEQAARRAAHVGNDEQPAARRPRRP